jgi:hypothetical protein
VLAAQRKPICFYDWRRLTEKNAWHQFKNRELDVASFLADVDLVWTHHERSEHTTGSLR